MEKFKLEEIPENLIEEEIKILSQGMSDDEVKKNKAKFTETAKTRIKTGLILNEFGEQNKIQVSEQEIQAEVQKQLRMMPGQEKMVMVPISTLPTNFKATTNRNGTQQNPNHYFEPRLRVRVMMSLVAANPTKQENKNKLKNML